MSFLLLEVWLISDRFPHIYNVQWRETEIADKIQLIHSVTAKCDTV